MSLVNVPSWCTPVRLGQMCRLTACGLRRENVEGLWDVVKKKRESIVSVTVWLVRKPTRVGFWLLLTYFLQFLLLVKLFLLRAPANKLMCEM